MFAIKQTLAIFVIYYMPTQQKKFLIDERYKQVAHMYLIGKTQREIAAVVGVSQIQVSRDLKAIHEMWRREAIIDMHGVKMKELARIDALEREAWDAWIESKNGTKRNKKTAMRKKGRDKSDNFFEQDEDEVLSSPGDPKFLDIVSKCIKQRVDILGIKAPEVTDNTFTFNANITRMDVAENLTIEDRANAVLKLLEKARQSGYVIDGEAKEVERSDSGTHENA